MVRNSWLIRTFNRQLLDSHISGVLCRFSLCFDGHERVCCQHDGVDCCRKFGNVMLGRFELTGPTLCNFTFCYARLSEEET